eukprot:453050-Pyramimonas_sp.AAC.1
MLISCAIFFLSERGGHAASRAPAGGRARRREDGPMATCVGASVGAGCTPLGVPVAVTGEPW